MLCKSYLLFIGVILHTSVGQSIWFCENNAECSSILPGMVCQSGSCICPPGNEIVDGNSCVPVATYHVSPCRATSQCHNLIINFECRKTDDNDVGECHCQEGSHFFLGRCWKSIGYGDQCTRNEECMGVLRDPYSFACVDGVCACAEGYYERQRGECREGSFNVGDDCMVHEDCRFEGGVCDLGTLKCVTPTAEPEPEPEPPKKKAETKSEYTTSSNLTSTSVTSSRNHGRACSTSEDCPNVFECTSSGYCACPRGYYANAAGSTCLAELGSPSTNNQCAGFLAQVIDGICRCPKNYYYHENMRDCIKATRRFNDACVDDNQCHTFGGSARCGEPGTFYLRTCDCIAEEAVWDENRQICRLFAGIGEYCEVDSDCLAGNMEILCVHGNGDESESAENGREGVGGVCSCPEGYSNVDGLCLTTGLALGDACQATSECTETVHTECIDGFCSCSEGYLPLEGTCASIIGGSCVEDYDCVTENSICDLGNQTCQCAEGFVGYDYVCWPHLVHPSNQCTVTAQCLVITGEASSCEEGQCVCFEGYHLRDGRCWPKTGLFEPCSRSSECFLEDLTDRVQCRNSLCQCSFEYPYSEELRTCMSSATTSVGSLFMTILALIYVKLNY